MAGGRVFGRGVFLWCAVGTVAGLLVGCSSGDEVKETFTPTATGRPAPVKEPGGASSTAGASPSAVYEPATETSPAKNVPVPKYPDAAKAETEEGQKAFIEYWFKTYNYALETGDTAPLAGASKKDCEFCVTSIKGVRKMWDQDKTWKVGSTAVPDLDTFTTQAESPLRATEFYVDEQPAAFWTKTGKSKTYGDIPGSHLRSRAWIGWDNGKWMFFDGAVVTEEDQ